MRYPVQNYRVWFLSNIEQEYQGVIALEATDQIEGTV